MTTSPDYYYILKRAAFSINVIHVCLNVKSNQITIISTKVLWKHLHCNFHLLHCHTCMTTYATQACSVMSCKSLWPLRDFSWCARLCVFTCASAFQICWDCGFAFPQRDAKSTHACVSLQSGLAQRRSGWARGSGLCVRWSRRCRDHITLRTQLPSPTYSSQPQAKRLADTCGLWLSDCVPHAQICKSDWQITQALVREERAFALRV